MNGTPASIAFWVFAAGAVWFGWRVFRTDSMVRASFSLLASFLNVGAILVLLLAEYLGVALLFMMAIEMTVMAIFMVAFMMNPAGLNPMMMVHQHRLSMTVGGLGAIALATLAALADFPERPLTGPTGTIERLGTELLGGSMLVFESAGIALLATMIGVIVLSSRSSRYREAADAGSLPPPLWPDQPDSVIDIESSGEHGHAGHENHEEDGEGENGSKAGSEAHGDGQPENGETGEHEARRESGHDEGAP